MATLPTHLPPQSGVYSIVHHDQSMPPVGKSASLFSMQNKTAIITGAGRGMGLEISVAYAEAGAVVYCLDLAEKPSEEWEKCRAWVDRLSEVPGFTGQLNNGRLEYVQYDVAQYKATQAVVDRIADAEGGVDVCVICAGIFQEAGILECDEENVDKILNVNLNGAIFTVQAVTRQMVARGIKGSIVMISSTAARVAFKIPFSIAYSTSKAALLQLARSVACELGPKGIRCNTISPGFVLTEMSKGNINTPELVAALCAENPLRRHAHLDEVRGAALFLGSDASTFCTGIDLLLDGGHTAW